MLSLTKLPRRGPGRAGGSVNVPCPIDCRARSGCRLPAASPARARLLWQAHPSFRDGGRRVGGGCLGWMGEGELAGSEERKGWSGAGAGGGHGIVVFFIPKPSLPLVTPSQTSWSMWYLIAPLLMAMGCSAEPSSSSMSLKSP